MGCGEVGYILICQETRCDCKEGNGGQGCFLHEGVICVLFSKGSFSQGSCAGEGRFPVGVWCGAM